MKKRTKRLFWATTAAPALAGLQTNHSEPLDGR